MTQLSELELTDLSELEDFEVSCIFKHCENPAEWYSIIFPECVCTHGTDMEFICNSHREFYLREWFDVNDWISCTCCGEIIGTDISFHDVISKIEKL